MSSACATALHNIGHAMELVEWGICDVVLAGGADELSAIYTSMFDGMRAAISTSFNDEPERATRPYDKNRDGFVISGGGGIVVVEDYERAKDRGATIYAEILGYGASSDGHDIIQPDPTGDGAYRAMTQAVEMAGCSAGGVDYVNSHGTSTPAGDIAEACALDRVFGMHKPSISSTKSLTGHGIGASSVQELPAERANCPPLPGCNSTQWIDRPSGIVPSGMQLPTSGSHFSPDMIWSSTFMPLGARM